MDTEGTCGHRVGQSWHHGKPQSHKPHPLFVTRTSKVHVRVSRCLHTAHACVSFPPHCSHTCTWTHVCTCTDVHTCAHKCTHTNIHMHVMHTYPSTSMRMGHFITTSPEINHTHSEINHTYSQTNHTLTAPTLKLTIPTHWTMPVTYGISLDIHT